MDGDALGLPFPGLIVTAGSGSTLPVSANGKSVGAAHKALPEACPAAEPGKRLLGLSQAGQGRVMAVGSCGTRGSSGAARLWVHTHPGAHGAAAVLPKSGPSLAGEG